MPKPNVREELIEAGLQTVYLQGFNGCSVQDITEAAGVPKGSFYNHFESKEALALAALERFWDYGTKRRAVLTDISLDPVERLRKHFQLLSDAIIKAKFERGCLIGNFSAEMANFKDFRVRLGEIYATWTGMIAACVEEASKAGRLSQKVPHSVVASFLVSSWEGAVLRAKVEHNRSALDDFSAVTFSCLFN